MTPAIRLLSPGPLVDEGLGALLMQSGKQNKFVKLREFRRQTGKGERRLANSQAPPLLR